MEQSIKKSKMLTSSSFTVLVSGIRKLTCLRSRSNLWSELNLADLAPNSVDPDP